MTGGLADLQARFHGFVVEDGPPPLDLVRAGRRTDAETLLAVYRDGYRLRLLEALGEDHPALKKFLGEEEFESMGRAYIAAVRSRHYSIRWFGGGLAEFLGADAGWRDRPELAALARWEWALGEAMDAADAAAVGREALAAIPPEEWAGVRLAFHPSLRRLDLGWTAPAFRLAVEAEEAALPAVMELNSPIAWAIWRDGTKILYRSLAPDEAAALDAAAAGATFGRICELMAESLGDGAAQAAAGFLSSWVGAGWIVRVGT